MCGVQATQVHDVVSQARGTRPYDACVIQSWLFCVVDVCRLCQERTFILDFNINSYTSKVLDVEHQISRVVCLDFCTIDGCTYTSATIFPDPHANWKIILLFTIEVDGISTCTYFTPTRLDDKPSIERIFYSGIDDVGELRPPHPTSCE